MAFIANEALYTELFKSLELNDEHREELKVKRGFTDATIDELGFKSASQKNGEVIAAMLEQYGTGPMFDCRLIDNNKKPSWQFTQDGLIIIPYLTSSGNVVFYKSHKRAGLTDAGVVPYCSKIFKGEGNMVVLCESEFKAASMWQMGYRAYGLGGIKTFAGKHIEKLTSDLMNVKKIVVLFDTEIQDDPAFSNFKDSYKKRYAQYVWSYILAKKISNYLISEGMSPEVLIASLPEEWTIDGKADIDGCVAAGKGREDFDIVIKNALSPDSYRDWIKVKPDHKAWVMRKMEAAFKNNIIFESNNCLYTNVNVKGKNMGTKEISNFKISLLSTTRFQGEIFRDIQLVNRYGDRTRAFHMKSDQFSSFARFKETCLSSGDYLWKGNETDFNNVIEMLFLETEANPITLLDYAGRSEEFGAWFFKNMMILDDETVVDWNEEMNAFAYDDKLFRVKWQSTSNASDICLSKKHIDIKEVVEHIEGGWGINGLIALGYMISTLFSNVYFERYKCFPIGLIHGEAGSGKSTLCDILALMLGFPINNPSMNISNTTQVAMSRKVAFYASLPVRFDEHRAGDRKIEDKYSLLRSLYNRQNSSKAHRFSITSTHEVPVRGCVTIIGEQRPNDFALISRCVPVFLSKGDKSYETLDHVNKLMQHGEDISNVTYQILTKYKENEKKFIENCIDTRNGLSQKMRKRDANFRVMQHFAGMMAGLSIVLTEDKMRSISGRIMNAFFSVIEQQSGESILAMFLQDLLTMDVDGEPVKKYAWIDHSTGNGYVFVNGLHQLWQKWTRSRRNEAATPFNTINQYFISQPYVIKKGVRKTPPTSISDVRVRVVEIDANSKDIQEPLKVILFGNAMEYDEEG